MAGSLVRCGPRAERAAAILQLGGWADRLRARTLPLRDGLTSPRGKRRFLFATAVALGSCLWYLNTSPLPSLSLGRAAEAGGLTGGVGAVVAELLSQPSKGRNLPGKELGDAEVELGPQSGFLHLPGEGSLGAQPAAPCCGCLGRIHTLRHKASISGSSLLGSGFS